MSEKTVPKDFVKHDIFLSYKYSGVPLEKLQIFMSNVIKVLSCDGKNNVVCNFDYLGYYHDNNMSTKEIMDHACVKLLDNIGPYDYHILLVSESGFSEGATFEYGYGYALSKIKPDSIKKRLFICHESINPGTCMAMSDEFIQYSTEDELFEKLKIKFQ